MDQSKNIFKQKKTSFHFLNATLNISTSGKEINSSAKLRVWLLDISRNKIDSFFLCAFEKFGVQSYQNDIHPRPVAGDVT